MYDWAASSVLRGGPFSNRWVLALRDVQGSDGERYPSAKPIAAGGQALLNLAPYSGNRGETVLADLAAHLDYLPSRDVLILAGWFNKRY